MNNEIKINRLYKKMREMSTRLYELREELVNSGTCTHQFTHDYTWDWDDGFGSSHKNTGSRCQSCMFIDPYKRGRWTNPLDYID